MQLADYSAAKKRFLFFFTTLAVLFTALLFFTEKGTIALAIVLFILAEIGYRAAQIFYDALLPEIAKPAEMGRIADLLAAQEEEKTPLQVELHTVGKRIALIVLPVAAVVFAAEPYGAWMSTDLGFFAALGEPVFRDRLTVALLVAISLAVAAIREGLPAIVTVSLSLGVRAMAVLVLLLSDHLLWQ